MKADFIQPRFEGARFSEHTLPVDVAKDLAAYEVLVVDLAKHLYLKQHTDRQRVPRGFASGFHLHFERIDSGSSKPMLSVVAAGMLVIGGGDMEFLTKARDLIAECIAAPTGQLPEAFPRELLSHFNYLGRSLLPDERMELPRTNGTVATLTPDRRKNLVLAADQYYEKAIELTGAIAATDWEKSTCKLRLSDGSQVTIPLPSQLHHMARNRNQVTLRGIAQYDSWDRIHNVTTINHLEVQPNFQLATQLDALLEIKPGWIGGRGMAFDQVKLASVSKKLVASYPEALPLPTIIPTPEGSILFEWSLPGSPSIDLYLDSMQADFHAFRPENAEIEKSFLLTSDDAWKQLSPFFKNHFMGPNTLLLRQVHPNFIPGGVLSSQAFMPFPKDEGTPSVYDGDLISAEDSHRHFTQVLQFSSHSVWGVTCNEVLMAGLTSRSDPKENFPSHALIDFTGHPQSSFRKLAKKLQAHAAGRGCLFSPDPGT